MSSLVKEFTLFIMVATLSVVIVAGAECSSQVDTDKDLEVPVSDRVGQETPEKKGQDDPDDPKKEDDGEGEEDKEGKEDKEDKKEGHKLQLLKKSKQKDGSRGKLPQDGRGKKSQGGPVGRKTAPKVMKPTIEVSQSGSKRRTPKPTILEDIHAYRHEPLGMVTLFEEKADLNLENVDFDAEVIAVIDGKKITKNDFMLCAVDSLGALEVDRFLTAVLTKVEKKKLTDAGEDPSQFDVPKEDIDNEIENQMLMTKQQDKSGTFTEKAWKEMIEKACGWDNYYELQRSNLAFGKVFLPDVKQTLPSAEDSQAPLPGFEPGDKEEAPDPVDPTLPIGKDVEGQEVNIFMPLHTWELLSGSDNDKAMRDGLNRSYKEGREISGFIRPQYIRMIKSALIARTEILYHTSGGLPGDVYMRVAGTDIKIKDLYPLMVGKLTVPMKNQILREILATAATDRLLAEGGWQLTEEEFETAYAEHEKMYEGSIFPIEFIMGLHGYYQAEDYRKMYRRRLGLKRMLESQNLMTDEVLKKFFETSARLFYQNGGVKIQSIFLGLFDHKELREREGGLEWADEKMAGILKELEGGADFLEVAKKYEDINGFNRPAETDFMTRNDMRSYFGEKSKSILTCGYSITDDIFYRAEPGKVIGPYTYHYSDFGNPVHRGIYLVKVIEYRSMLELNPYDKSKPTIEEDYLDLSMIHLSSKVLSKADIAFTRKGE